MRFGVDARRLWHAAQVVVVVGVALLPAACGSPPESPCPETYADTEGLHPTSLSDIAAPYAGKGPHPVVHAEHGVVRGAHEGVPQSWQSAEGADSSTQLVLCEYVEESGEDSTGSGAYAPGCPYEGGLMVPWVEARYRYHLYEARTSTLVTSFEVGSTPGTCPDQIFYFEDESPEPLVESVDAQTLEKKLRPYVEGPARQ